ncbi:MAG: hypothetical protein KGZ83_18175 [Sulfuricella sp.]|nr:hypothetical protein [Sulfuricella sp.]
MGILSGWSPMLQGAIYYPSSFRPVRFRHFFFGQSVTSLASAYSEARIMRSRMHYFSGEQPWVRKNKARSRHQVAFHWFPVEFVLRMFWMIAFFAGWRGGTPDIHKMALQKS